ncbi:hypothetical protein LP7551_05612 [Roseibium album]|nr:hypothetical protein LP7551_05612 [Roseibium album]
MKHARQITLHDRLSVMFRGLPGVAAAALVFSLVYFSPLIDMKDTIAAAADHRGDRDSDSDRDNDRGDRSERGERGDRGDRSERGDRGNRDAKDRRDDDDDQGSNRSQRNANKEADNDKPAKKAREEKGRVTSSTTTHSGNSNKTASEKPPSGSLLKRIFGEPQFSGDSEPSGNALSEREEREAIQNGWK